MMARQHVALGFAGYMTTVSTLGGTNPLWPHAPHVAWLETAAQPYALLLGSVIAAAFAIWPDIDHPNSTISKKLGPLGFVLSPVIRVLCFGHRGLSHTWLFAAVTGSGTLFLSELLNATWGALATKVLVGVIAALSALLITKLILPGGVGGKGAAPMVLAAGLVAIVAFHPAMANGLWVAFAVAFGTALHDLGDMLTTGGVQFLWPLPVKIAVPLVGNTNSAIERLVAGPAITWVNVVFTALVVVYPLAPQIHQTLQLTMTVALGVAAFDLVTRLIAGKPQFAGH